MPPRNKVKKVRVTGQLSTDEVIHHVDAGGPVAPLPIGPGEGRPHQRTIYQREMDRTEMMRLMRRGYTQTEIAQRLNIASTTVSKDWLAVKQEMRSRREEDAREKIQMLLDEIHEIKREAWDAWEKSKTDAEKRLEEEADTVRGLTSRRQVIRELQSGDPRFLQTVLNCIDAEADLQALRPPKTNVLPMPVIPWDALGGLLSGGNHPHQLQGPSSAQVIEGNVVPNPPTTTSQPTPTSSPQSPAPSLESIEDRIIAMAEKAAALRKVQAQEEVRMGNLHEEPDHDPSTILTPDDSLIVDSPTLPNE